MSRSAATLVTSIIKDVEAIPLTKHTSCASLADANRLREIDSNSSKKLRGYLKKFLEYELPMFIEGRNMIFFSFSHVNLGADESTFLSDLKLGSGTNSILLTCEDRDLLRKRSAYLR